MHKLALHMFEFTVSSEKKNSHYIDFLYGKLKDEIKKAEAVIAHSEVDDRVFFSVGCEEKTSANIRDLLFDVIADIFALGFKNDYLKKNLKICDENLLSRTVLNTMTVLDSGIDKMLIKRTIKKENKIALEGFFEFRLQELKERWSEVAQLANSNAAMFEDENIVCDFLSFLIESIPETVNCLRIIKNGEATELLDDKGRVQTAAEVLDRNYISAEEKLLFNVICLNPKNVIVENEKLFSDEFNRLIKDFF